MIHIIDKQLEFFTWSWTKAQGNEKALEMIRVLELFKEVFNTVLTGDQKGSSALSLFVAQLIKERGNVDFVRIVDDFIKTHKRKQTQIKDKTGIPQARVS